MSPPVHVPEVLRPVLIGDPVWCIGPARVGRIEDVCGNGVVVVCHYPETRITYEIRTLLLLDRPAVSRPPPLWFRPCREIFVA